MEGHACAARLNPTDAADGSSASEAVTKKAGW